MSLIYKDGQYYGKGGSEMPAEDMAEVASPLPSVMSRRFKYSTEEQIVGEWIDGKPIYQKTFTGGTSKTDGNVYDCSDLSIDTLVNIGGIFASGFDVNCYYSSNAWISSRVAEGHIKTTCASAWNNLDIVITIQYTKTTD